MANLRDLLFGYGEGQAIEPGEFAVFATNIQDASNSGRCCLWTVPAGVSYAVFEIWSGGGGAGCARYCGFGGGAGGGGYAVKSCTVAPGQEIRICAASSTNCSGNCYGECGCCSFVCSLGGGGQSTWLASVCGGRYADRGNQCTLATNCYHCCSMCYCCGGITNGTFDFCVPGTTGTAHPTQYCMSDAKSYAGTAPYTAGGPSVGCNPSWCSGGSCYMGQFPGGGGVAANTLEGVCCQGGPGAGGLVYVLYY